MDDIAFEKSGGNVFVDLGYSPEDAAEEARLDAKAMADYRAGRIVPHAKVVEWLDSWGTPNESPRPKPEPR